MTTPDTAPITADLVRLDADLGADKDAVIGALADVVRAAGRVDGDDGATRLADDVRAREQQAPTGLPGGIALPHCRTTAVDEPTLALARLSPKVAFGAKDGPADLVVLIAGPADGAAHLTLLTRLARALVKGEFTNGLRRARSAQEAADLVAAVVEADTGPTAPESRAR